jgi:DNA mismatch repair protein MutS
VKSPAQKQHEKLKAAHPEFVHFFRVGDFIQLYGDDAGVAVRVIGCVPVTRKDDDGEHLMTGFPADQLEKCLRKMIAAGHKCAVCDPAA